MFLPHFTLSAPTPAPSTRDPLTEPLRRLSCAPHSHHRTVHPMQSRHRTPVRPHKAPSLWCTQQRTPALHHSARGFHWNQTLYSFNSQSTSKDANPAHDTSDRQPSHCKQPETFVKPNSQPRRNANHAYAKPARTH